MRAQRGHRGCASAGTDAHLGSNVGARVRHVIDRGEGEGAQSVRHLVLALVLEVSPTQGYYKERKEYVCSTVRQKGEEREIESTVTSKTVLIKLT